MMHSGSCRYYGGRLTLRYDLLDPKSLDTAVQWFNGQGIHPYALLDDFELGEFRRRFGSQVTVQSLAHAVFVYNSAPKVYLLDLLATTNASPATVALAETLDQTTAAPPVFVNTTALPR
jgi:hypothetical protein